jgi:hypothetical protein
MGLGTPIRAAALAALFSCLAACIVSGVVSWAPGAAVAAPQTQMIVVPASGFSGPILLGQIRPRSATLVPRANDPGT